jgi:hypothetical protein
MNKQKWMILGGIGIVLVVAGSITAAVLYFNDDAQPILSSEEILDQDPMTTARYMASKDFAKLPEDQKQKYLDTIMSDRNKRREMFAQRDKLSDSEKKQLRKNMGPVFRNHMKKRIDNYSKLPPDEREEYLDKMIDQMQEMRENRPPRNSEGSGERSTSSRRRRGPTPARMKKWLESTTPSDRAKMAQFMMDMRARMKARGIERPWHR